MAETHSAFPRIGIASRAFVLVWTVAGPSYWEKRMRIRLFAASAAFAAGLAALPIATAEAQYYYPPCSPFPLAWPFCIAGAAVNTAATIVTAPFVAFSGPYYYPYYGYRYGYYGHPRHH
jgi:hypothetical protein